jgi:hypothetical protein
MNTVSVLMNNYSFCELFAQQHLLEALFISIEEWPHWEMEDRGEGRSDLLLVWVGMVEESQRGWPDLWEEMYRESVEVLWGILA